MRAEEKVRLERAMRDGREQTVVVPIGWQSIQEKNFSYDMTTSFLLTPDKPGVPKPIKIQEQHRPFFPLDRPITSETGTLLAEWCAGGKPVARPRRQPEVSTGAPDDDIVTLASMTAEDRQREFVAELVRIGREAATKGTWALRQYYKALDKNERAQIEGVVMQELLPVAQEVDQRLDQHNRQVESPIDDPNTDPRFVGGYVVEDEPPPPIEEEMEPADG